MIGRWNLGPRLAGPMSRRPGRIAVIALLVGALGATGLLRFAVDSGQSLLVGSSSSAGQTYASFVKAFGSDPIVVVLAARNPASLYAERNLERLGALEVDLAHDPRVASVLGPGTIAGSLREAAVAEVSKVLTEYPYFVAETDYLEQLQKGKPTQQQIQQRFQSDISNATALLELDVVKAATAAESARSQYVNAAGAKLLDSREKAVDAAVSKSPLPPLFAEYLAGPGQTADPAAAQQFFAQVTAAYGDCDSQIAGFLKIQPNCQVFFERALLDLPNCPPMSSQLFCNPKPQWAAVLPAPQPGGDSHAIITVRLRPQFVGDQSAVASLRDKVNGELAHGIASDPYTRSLPAASLTTLKALGPLTPTECGGASAQQDSACVSAFHDAPLSSVIAGAPLLGLGVVRSITQLLAILLPVALFVMLLLLVGTFRVRGRVWPLVAASAATVLTVGGALLTGTSITPAVLAGTPVLVGLGVDYAVQLVARFSEERSRQADGREALSRVLGNTAHATLIAAITTVAGLAALALVSGVDGGPLAAVPLVAEFALVLCGGVVLAWLGAVFIALPLAVWSDQRQAVAIDRPSTAAAARTSADAPPAAARTLAIADNWKGVVAPLSILGLFGWVLLHVVPVQTDVQQLLATSLPELADIQTVQAQTGYTNEVDVYVRGPVATGPLDTQTGTPADIEWQCGVASLIRTDHSDTVGQATSIGDYLIGSTSRSGDRSAAPCVPPRSGSTSSPTSPAPSASPGATATPSTASPSPSAPSGASASPTSYRGAQHAVTALELVASASASASTTAASPAPSATGLPSPSPSALTSPAPTPSAAPAPRGATASATQTRFLCALRLLPQLSRTLVMDIGVDTVPCPPVDEYQQLFLTADATPINPTAARIAIGVHTASVAEQSKLVGSLRGDLANPPNGMTATPTGLAVLATTAYDNLANRAYLLNIAPILLVACALFAVYRRPRRALLPLIPTVLAAGWAPILLLLLGRLPGGVGSTLGSLNPLTVVLGALIVALGTEFGVVLLGRFYEELARGCDAPLAAGAALQGAGRAIRVSALTLGAGFAVLALSGLFPNSLPLIADFGLAVVIDLALAVAAVFVVMLPVAVVVEQRFPTRDPIRAAAPAPAVVTPAPRRAARAPRRPRAAREAAPPALTAPMSQPVAEPAPARERPIASPGHRATGSREARDRAARLKAAGFPVRKSLDDFQVAQSSVPESAFEYLASLDWIRATENVCLVGPAGTGKSHVLVGLGNAAVAAGHRVRYFSALDLIEMLHGGVADSSVGKVVDELLRNQLLVVDDLGFARLDSTDLQLLFRFVAAAYERRSLAIGSHLPLDEWAASLPDQRTAASIVDRLMHHAVVVVTEGESFRVKEARSRADRPVT